MSTRPACGVFLLEQGAKAPREAMALQAVAAAEAAAAVRVWLAPRRDAAAVGEAEALEARVARRDLAVAGRESL